MRAYVNEVLDEQIEKTKKLSNKDITLAKKNLIVAKIE